MRLDAVQLGLGRGSGARAFAAEELVKVGIRVLPHFLHVHYGTKTVGDYCPT